MTDYYKLITKSCKFNCTKHHEKYNDSKWIDAIRALLHKLNEKISKNLIIIFDLKIKVFFYQLLDMWVELKMKKILNEEMNCDDSKLKKINCRFCHVRNYIKNELIDSTIKCHEHQCRDNHE